jgi:hypothetical protein
MIGPCSGDPETCECWCIMCREKGCAKCKPSFYSVTGGGHGGYTRFCGECVEAVYYTVKKQNGKTFVKLLPSFLLLLASGFVFITTLAGAEKWVHLEWIVWFNFGLFIYLLICFFITLQIAERSEKC